MLPMPSGVYNLSLTFCGAEICLAIFPPTERNKSHMAKRSFIFQIIMKSFPLGWSSWAVAFLRKMAPLHQRLVMLQTEDLTLVRYWFILCFSPS